MGMRLSPVPPMMLVDVTALNEAESQETGGQGRGVGPVFHVRGGKAGGRACRPCRLHAARNASWRETCSTGRGSAKASVAGVAFVVNSTPTPTPTRNTHWAGLTLTEEYASIRTVLRIPGGNPFAVRREAVPVGPTLCEVTGILVGGWEVGGGGRGAEAQVVGPRRVVRRG
jgi:hypothetical protein